MPDETYAVEAQFLLNAGQIYREIAQIGQRFGRLDAGVQTVNQGTQKLEANMRAVATATARVRKVGNDLQAFGQRMRAGNAMAGALTRNLIAIGATYVGFNAVAQGIGGMRRAAFGFNAEMEATRIGLASVLSAVEGTDFEAGLQRAHGVWRELSADALTSVATTQELFQIYQGIVGPIRHAGKSLDVVRSITASTVSASTALGVDLEQAQRDISLMVRGAAGMDVKLFSMLRSTGAIAESTEEWNKNLSAEERIDKLSDALAKFDPAAKAYGRSWKGVTSSFADIVQQLMGVGSGPAFRSITTFIGGINDRLLANREALTATLEAWGSTVGARLDATFARILSGLDHVIANWDVYSGRVDAAVKRFQELVPALVTAGKVFAAYSVGRPVLGAAAGGAGTAIKLGERLSAGAGRAHGAVAPAVRRRMADPLGIAAGVGAGLAPGWFGGGAGAAATAGAASGASAAAAGGAGTAAAAGAAGGTLAAMAPALIAVAGAAALVAGVWAAITAHSESLGLVLTYLEPLLGGLWEQISLLGSNLAGILLPRLKVVGHLLIVGVGAAFVLLATTLRVVLQAANAFLGVWRELSGFIYDTIGPAFDWLYQKIAGWLNQVISLFGDRLPTATVGGTTSQDDPLVGMQRAWQQAQEGRGDPRDPLGFGVASAAPGQRQTVVNDFRGSRFTIKQDFRRADPDRVAVQFMQDIQRHAEARIQGGFVPALTRS